MTASVHDIVVLSSVACERIAADAPPWVGASLSRAPAAVVRRERLAGRVCIGIRGSVREERYAADLYPEEIRCRATPEELARVSPPRMHPVFAALRKAATIAQAHEVAWGPAGAAAFELATGVPVLNDGSDLDVVLRLHPADERVPALSRAFKTLGTRVDAELCFDDGCGVSLDEAVSSKTLLVKTARGPALVDVWAR